MIVVFGSLNVNISMRVEKLPRPGETLLCPSYSLHSGGKGTTQALAAAKAGAAVKLFGKIGEDNFGQLALSSLKTSSVDFRGVTRAPQAHTGCATLYLTPRGPHMISVASGANLQAQEAEIPGSLLSAQILLLLQMETSPEENWKLIRRAKKHGARILLNLSPAQTPPLDILSIVDILVVNKHEAALLGLYLGFEVISPLTTARRIAARFNTICIVTLGSEGVIACCPNETWAVEALKGAALSSPITEDAFIGALAANLDAGIPLTLALHSASIAAGLTCLRNGVLPSSLQIQAHLNRVPLPYRIA